MSGRIKLSFAAAMLLASLSGAVSCSFVKEDRSDCPCYLDIYLTDAVGRGWGTSIVRVYQQGESLLNGEVDPDELGESPYKVQVPREWTTVCGVTGLENGLMLGDTLTVTRNGEWDPVFAGVSYADCAEDDCATAVIFHKNYCEVGIVIVGFDYIAGYPYDLRVSAECSGMRLSDLSPVGGTYTAWASSSSPGIYSVRLPRQLDNVIILDLLEESEDRQYFPEDLLFEMDLGARLALQGYNWAKPDLDDVYVTLDFSRQDVTVEIKPWVRYDVEAEI